MPDRLAARKAPRIENRRDGIRIVVRCDGQGDVGIRLPEGQRIAGVVLRILEKIAVPILVPARRMMFADANLCAASRSGSPDCAANAPRQ